MEIEESLLKLYFNFIKENSIFSNKVLIVPKTPQSFSMFPTIVIKENNNIDYIGGKTLNREENINQLTYIVEIYTKDMVFEGKKYSSKEVQKELKLLTYKFFNNIGFRRTSSAIGEYLDVTVDRNVNIFEGKINDWNGQLI